MGTHPGGPSKIRLHDKTALLSEIAELPFLLKYLAAAGPLSIQTHPNLDQAREGFEQENTAGIDLNDPERNYKDPNHKPEILCALGPFTAMAGFRERQEAEQLLSLVSGAGELISALKEGYRPFLSALFGLDENERKKLNGAVLSAESGPLQKKNYSGKSRLICDPGELLNICREFSKVYPGDPGILSPLYLNVIKLEPYEAIYIPAGVLHAYIKGFAMECMANSDNVLRGGLTPKHIDIHELFSILSFEPFVPELLEARELNAGSYKYKDSCKEFSFYRFENRKMPDSTKITLNTPGMGIFTVFTGSVEISVMQSGIKKSGTAVLNKGESVFVGPREKGEYLQFSGGEPSLAGARSAGDSGDFLVFSALAAT
jgi:mannose-6-phosphate isomerase